MPILRRNQHRKMTWRNGGGSTWEVLREPASTDPAGADLRMSFARIEEDGPFSSFPGLDRVLTLARGGVLTLVIDGCETTFRPGQSAAFPGEAEVISRLSEASIDFNVMTRRGVCRAEVEVHALGSAGLATKPDPMRRFISPCSTGERASRCPASRTPTSHLSTSSPDCRVDREWFPCRSPPSPWYGCAE